MEEQVLNTDNLQQVQSDSTPFYAYRKVVKCLSDGISLYTDNLKQLILLTWPYILMGLGVGVALGWCIPYLGVYGGIATLVLGFLLMSYLVSVSYAYVMKKCVVKKDKPTWREVYNLAWRKMPRILFAGAVSLCVWGVYVFLMRWTLMSLSHDLIGLILMSAIGFLLTVAVLVVVTPMNLANSAVLLDRTPLLKTYFTGFKYGMSTWLRLFSLVVMISIITLVVILLLCAPLYVLQMIDFSSAQSILSGDSVNLPSGLAYVKCAVILICGFLMCHLCIVNSFVYAYFYASTKADIKEREANTVPLI